MENGAGAPLPIPPLYGDFSLNAANVVTARRLLQEGLGRLAPTHDLSAEQLMALAEGLGEGAAPHMEVVIHQVGPSLAVTSFASCCEPPLADSN